MQVECTTDTSSALIGGAYKSLAWTSATCFSRSPNHTSPSAYNNTLLLPLQWWTMLCIYRLLSAHFKPFHLCRRRCEPSLSMPAISLVQSHLGGRFAEDFHLLAVYSVDPKYLEAKLSETRSGAVAWAVVAFGSYLVAFLDGIEYSWPVMSGSHYVRTVSGMFHNMSMLTLSPLVSLSDLASFAVERCAARSWAIYVHDRAYHERLPS